MMNIWRAMFVKEFNELKWKLFSLVAIYMTILTAIALIKPSQIRVTIMVCLYVHAIFGTLFLAMTVAAGEHSRSTIHMLRALPVPLWKIMTARLLTGVAACLLPFVAIILSILILIMLNRGYLAASNEVSITILVLAISVISLTIFLWTTAVAVNQPSEVRAGLIGICIIVGWYLLMAVISELLGNLIHQYSQQYNLYAVITIAITPTFGWVIAFDPGHSALVRIPAVIFQFAWFVVLFSITVKRFGRITRHDDRSPTQSIDTRHQTKLQLTNPRRSPLSAIIWKQWRQTLPLCVLGLILFVLFTCLLILANSPTSGHYDETTNRIIFTKMDYLKFVGLQFRFAAIIIGPLLALVVGIAAASSELNSRLLAFWGSRPISRSLWFWAMYLSGGLLFMLTIYLPIVLVSFFQNPDHLIQLKVYVAAMTPLLVLIYTFAVFCACSLRHTFYAIVMASALSLAYIAIPTFNSHLEFFSVTDIWRSCEISLNNNSNIWQISAYPYYLTVTLILTAAILFLARAAAQCNNQPIADE